MITGFNTDVEHDGVIYHVQTEDKGLATPLILSLVYTGGEILASKRSPYEDLITAGFDEATLAERIQRQHRLICAAIHAGRVEDLKRMAQRALEGKRGVLPPEVDQIPIPTAFQAEQEAVMDYADLPLEVPETPDEVAIAAGASPVLLRVNLLEERELRGGQFVTLRVRVSRGPIETQESVPDAHVVLKTLGTTFRPVSTFAKTDKDGVAIMFAALPKFTTGRGAILVRADVAGEKAELRRIILPA